MQWRTFAYDMNPISNMERTNNVQTHDYISQGFRNYKLL